MTSKISLALNSALSIVLCVPCGVGLPSSRSCKRHLTLKHGLGNNMAERFATETWTAKDEYTSTLAAAEMIVPYGYPGLETQAISPLHFETARVPRIFRPVRGVKMETGFKCILCKQCNTDMRSLANHIDRLHKDSNKNSLLQETERQERIFLQTLFSGRSRKLFPVTIDNFIGEVMILQTFTGCEPRHGEESMAPSRAAGNSSQSDNRDALCAFRRAVGSGMTSTRFDSIADGSSHRKSSFVEMSRVDWILKSMKLSLEDAHAAATINVLPEISMLQKLMKKQVFTYLVRARDLAPLLPPFALQKINMRGDWCFMPVSTKSAEHYALHLVRLLLFVWRGKSSHTQWHTMKAMKSVCRYVQTLKTCLLQGDIDEKHLTGDHLGGIEGAVLLEEHLTSLHDAFSSVLLELRDPYISAESMSVRNFLAAACIHKDRAIMSNSETAQYRFCEASEITHVLAALQYGISVCALRSIWILNGVAARNSGLNNESEQENLLAVDASMKLTLHSLNIEANTVASYIRNSLNLATGLSKTEDIDVSYEMCEDHSQCGVVRNVHLSLPKLGRVIRQAHDQIRNIIFEDLLRGNSLPSCFLSELHSLEDDLSNRESGFCFLMKPKYQVWIARNTNHVVQCLTEQSSRASTAAIVACAKDRIKMSMDPNDKCVMVGGVAMYRPGVLRWLQACQKVQQVLLACMHCSYGSPARATELETLSLTNDLHGQRNIFIHQSRIAVITRYIKTRNLQRRSRTVVRFPDVTTGELLILYLSLFRPLESAMVGALHGEGTLKSHWQWLFVDRGVPYTETRIRNAVVSLLEGGGIPMRFNDFRNYTVGMVPAVSSDRRRSILNESMDEFAETGHMQAGHNAITAEIVYARRMDDISTLTRSEITKYREWSKQWHVMLGLEEGSFPSEGALSRHGDPVKHIKANMTDERQMKRRKQEDKTVFHCGAESPRVNRSASDRGSRSLASFPPSPRESPALIRPEGGKEVSRGGCTVIRPSMEGLQHHLKSMLNLLRRATQKESALFLSHMQFCVTVRVAERKENMLVSLPTGSGKTFCILLPMLAERGKMCSIVIVPLVALAAEYVRRAADVGISVSDKMGSQYSEFDLYVLTAEQVQKPLFAAFVSGLERKARLARVVVDEAHLTTLWDDFRQSLAMIRYGLAQIGSEVPRILMSATVPPCQRSLVLSSHSVRRATLYTMPSERKNLRFQVRNVDPNCTDETARSRTGNGTFSSPSDALFQAVSTYTQQYVQALCISSMQGMEFSRVIMYAMSRAKAEKLCDILQAQFVMGAALAAENDRQGGSPEDRTISVEVLCYHGGLSNSQRNVVHSAWMKPEVQGSSKIIKVRIMTCTSAFGTGVDSANVRLVIHVGGSYGLLEYAQEVGRAGRDSRTADCVLFYSRGYADSFSEQLRSKCEIGMDECGYEKMTAWSQLRKWIENRTMCRKQWLYGFIDGSPGGICLFDPESTNCDICSTEIREGEGVDQNSEQPSTAISANASGGNRKESSNPLSSTESVYMRSQGLVSPRERCETLSSAPIAHRARMGTSATTSESASRAHMNRNGQSNISPGKHPAIQAIHKAPEMISGSSSDVYRVREVAREVKGMCLFCLVNTHETHNLITHRCGWKAKRCLRCFSTAHSVSSCIIRNQQQGRCFKCLIGYHGKHNVHGHGVGYGSTCLLYPLRELGWVLWRNGKDLQKEIAKHLFPGNSSKSYNDTFDVRRGGEDLRDNVFLQWLTTNDSGASNLVRLIIWWLDTEKVLRI